MEDEAAPKWIIKPENFPNLEQNFDAECPKVDTTLQTDELYNKFDKMIQTTMDKSFKRKNNKRHVQKSYDILHKDFKPISRELIKFAARGKIQRKVAQQIRDKIHEMNTEKVSSRNAEKL